MSGTITGPQIYQYTSSNHSLLWSMCSKVSYQFVIDSHEACYLSSRAFPHICLSGAGFYSSTRICKRMGRSIKSNADNNGLNVPSGNDDINSKIRLFNLIRTLQVKLNKRLRRLRSRFFIKTLFFLVGFYCATAFATVIGQTGEWDIFSAGLAVVVVEGIGALMYKGSFPFIENVRGIVTMFNYWKTGLCLGLFLDAFKFEMDDIFGFSSPFKFNFDAFPLFL